MNKLQKSLPDLRYTVALEYTGQYRNGAAGKQHVTRFCGEFVVGSDTQQQAIEAAHSHSEERLA